MFRADGRKPSALFMDLKQLSMALAAMGCPAEKCDDMAAQLDKRARQLMQVKGRSYDESVSHLLGLMRQGWSAKDRGL